MAQKSPSPAKTQSSDLAFVARRLGLCFLLGALGLSLYLAYTSLTNGTVAGCAEGGGCHTVIASKWGYLLGIPVSLFGALTYLTLLGSEWKGCCAWLHAVCRWLILGAALWFVAVQVFILGEFCPWCCLTHTLAALGALCLWRRSPRAAADDLSGHTHLAPVLGLLALAGVIAIQTLGPDRPTTAGGSLAEGQGAQLSEASQQGPRTVSLHGGQFVIEVDDFPSIGNAKIAEHVAVGLFDFTCPHCQQLIKTLTDIQEVFGDRLAVIQLPGHFNDKGEAIQKLMLAVWREDRESYHELADLLHEGTLRAAEEEVQAAIGSVVDPDQHQEWMAKHDAWSSEVLANSQAIREANRKLINTGKFPQLMLGDYVEAGNMSDMGHYYSLLEEHFGLKRTEIPKLVAEPTRFDMGELYVGASNKFSLTLKNPDGPTVHLRRPRLVRGMRLLKPPAEELVSGEETVMQFSAQPPLPGDINGEIFIFSDAAPAKLIIPVTAKATAVFQANPAFANLGTYEGRPLTGTINLSFIAPVKLGTPRPNNPREFRVSVDEVEDGLRYQLTVVATPNPNRVGQHQTSIQIPVRPVDSTANWPTQIQVAARCTVNAKAPPSGPPASATNPASENGGASSTNPPPFPDRRGSNPNLPGTVPSPPQAEAPPIPAPTPLPTDPEP